MGREMTQAETVHIAMIPIIDALRLWTRGRRCAVPMDAILMVVCSLSTIIFDIRQLFLKVPNNQRFTIVESDERSTDSRRTAPEMRKRRVSYDGHAARLVTC